MRSSDFVNVAEDSFLDTLVLHNFTENTAISTSDDKNLLRVRVRVHGEMRDHLLVAVPSAVSSRGQDEPTAVLRTYENSSRSVHWITLSNTSTVP